MTGPIHRLILSLVVILATLEPAYPAAALDKVNAGYGAISGSMAQTWVAKEAPL